MAERNPLDGFTVDRASIRFIGHDLQRPECILAEPDGTLWKNITTEEKSRVAQTLDDFRGAYRYNLLDEHLREMSRWYVDNGWV